MLKLFILVFAVGIQSSLAASVIGDGDDDPTALTATATPCAATDDPCVMTCTVPLDSTADLTKYNLNACCWKYYDDASDPTHANVTIFDVQCDDTSADHYGNSLTLTTYNSGQYVCVFDISYNTTEFVTLSASVTVDDTVQPVDLGATCTNDTECLALNSECADDGSGSGPLTCQCLTNYTVPLKDGGLTLACLEPEPVNGTCNIDDECSQVVPGIICDANVCTCHGTITYVADKDEDMCIAAVPLSGGCTYSEQCLLSTPNSACGADGICACATDFILDVDQTTCVIDMHLSVTVEPCAAEDFANGSACEMSCTVVFDADADPTEYTLSSWCWKYSIDDSDPSAIIFDGTNVNETEFVTYLSLPTYNAGSYVCYFEISFNDSINTIPGTPVAIAAAGSGVALGGTCGNATDCLALDSICGDDLKCQCPSNYNMTLNGATDTIACLAQAPMDGGCNIEEQCLRDNQDIHCEVNVCTCNGTKVDVAETGSNMCLDPANFGEPCSYNEQCSLGVPNNAVCSSDKKCACASGYSAANGNKECNKDDSGLSGGAIAGIVIGSLAGCAIIGGVVFYIVKKKK